MTYEAGIEAAAKDLYELENHMEYLKWEDADSPTKIWAMEHMKSHIEAFLAEVDAYTYEVYEILHGDWDGVVPDGAFRTEGRPGWLVPLKGTTKSAQIDSSLVVEGEG